MAGWRREAFRCADLPRTTRAGTLQPVATGELQSALAQFVTFAHSLKGDEKGEGQTFLDHFFRALGHKSAIEAGATFEFRVAKKPGSAQLELIKGNGATPRVKGGKKFADLLWRDRVLIEMKSRGENLEKHYDQLSIAGRHGDRRLCLHAKGLSRRPGQERGFLLD